MITHVQVDIEKVIDRLAGGDATYRLHLSRVAKERLAEDPTAFDMEIRLLPKTMGRLT